MTPTQAVVLCRLAKAMCPQQHFDEYTPDSWFELIGDLDFDDAKDALSAVAAKQAFVAPADIATEVRRVRHERALLADSAEVPAEIEAIDDPDEFDRAYRRWRGELRSRLANGDELPPTPLALPASPSASRKVLAAIEQTRASLTLAAKESATRRAEVAAQRKARRAAALELEATRPNPVGLPDPRPVEEVLAEHTEGDRA